MSTGDEDSDPESLYLANDSPSARAAERRRRRPRRPSTPSVPSIPSVPASPASPAAGNGVVPGSPVIAQASFVGRRGGQRPRRESRSPGPDPEPEPDTSYSSSSSSSSSSGSSSSGLSSSDDGLAPPFARNAAPLRRRVNAPQGFRIARVIQNSDKAGTLIDAPGHIFLDPNDPDDDGSFVIALGDFVLVLSGPYVLNVKVRNYQGQEGRIPRRMLQDCYNPWHIPRNIRLVRQQDGVEFPLHFVQNALSLADGDGTAFEDGEAIMLVRNSPNQTMSEVYDFERKPGTIADDNLAMTHPVPWNIYVDEQQWEDRYAMAMVRKPRRSARVIGQAAVQAIENARLARLAAWRTADDARDALNVDDLDV